MIQNLILWNNFLENFVSGTQLSDFLAKSLKAKKKLAKKITHFTIQFYSKILTLFMNLN